ncbi:hypothetical protein PV10_04641 [Exophiala mesophila]|uniref:Major facilitator superfamily (MFS) profile domain-containing protein n=1 Tax=Exophiala mesophila TaxID=212818 RepID=A0A0D2A328_EXOME|nr:uncharacterized protein PV10_04641 [Exophiala mesophila]KIV93428.1 hypothetical protein PV10_04641 [Exophiala mesophila]
MAFEHDSHPLPPHEEDKERRESQTKSALSYVGDQEKVDDKPDAHDDHDTGPIKGDFSDGRVNWTTKQILATIGLCGLYVGSQIPLYFSGGALTYIAISVGAADKASWIPVAYALVFSAISPFCGYLQDIMGRRNITLLGGVVVIVGNIIMATTHSFAQAIAGMAITGAGAAVGELTALAGMSELVPVTKRGIYLAIVTVTIFPFTPYVLYCQLLSVHATWRWLYYICIIFNSVSLAGIAAFYFPLSQTRAAGQTAKSILKQIDIGGAILSISGLTLILIALQSGGLFHPWSSAYVLCTLIIGILLVVAFALWEWKFAKFPIIPHEMFTGQRVVAMALVICFVAGMGLMAVVNFFPLMFSTVFTADPLQVGLRTLAPGMANNIGAIIINTSLSYFKKYNRELLLLATVIMTVFTGALATVTPDSQSLAITLGTFSSLGVGGIIVPAATVAIIATPDTSIATCVALTLCIRQVGGSIGTAIYFNVLQAKLKTYLPASVAQYALAAGLPANSTEEFVMTFLTAPDQAALLPGVDATILQQAAIGTRWAYAAAFKYVWYTSVGFGCGAVIACCFLGNPARFHTNRIAAVVRG